MTTSIVDLADILKSREIKTIYYFHTDHYEPWSLGLNERTARGVERFADMSQASPFARRMSLFYSAYVPYNLDLSEARSAKGRRAGPDGVVFPPRSIKQEELACKVIRPLFTPDRHELHLHVHHEFWTRNDSHFDTEVSKWVNACSTAELDKDRLDLFFRLCAETIGGEVGRPFDRWAFIHGNWALAASDPLICTIENELEMIMQHGGWGDFSFPAGRAYCDPKLESPFTCRPIHGKRVYDEPEADARPVAAGSGAITPKRFFIWNSPIKAQFSSLDYYSEPNRELFKDRTRILTQWLKNSVSYGGDLFIKTHAHSMKWEYEIFKPDSHIPHLYPAVVDIFEDLLRICDCAGVEFRPVTVNEVMEVLGTLDAGRTIESGAGLPPSLSAADSGPALPSEAKLNGPSLKASEPASIEDRVGVDEIMDLETRIKALLHEWVYADDHHKESAGSFYLELLKGTHLLQDFERAVLNYAISEFPVDRTTIFEVGIGYGILSLMLAAKGYKVIASEGNQGRLEGFEFVLASLEKYVPGIGARVTSVHDWFPDSFASSALKRDQRNVLLITNIVASAAAKRQAAILQAAKSFDDLIVDRTRFGITRYDAESAGHLHDTISAQYRPIAEVWCRKPNEIWHFRPLQERKLEDALPVGQGPPDRADQAVTVPVLLEVFNAELLKLQRQWLAGEGASLQKDDLYSSKINRGVTLEAHEVAVASAVAERFDCDRVSVVEIGSGYGALTLLLGRYGFSVQSFDGDPRRAAASAWHLEQYAERYPEILQKVHFAAGFFPDAFASAVEGTRKRCICLATNVTCTYTATHQQVIFEAMRSFDDVIFDLARFGRNRDSQAERDELREALVEYGFVPIERLYFAEPYEYWRFRRRQAVSKSAILPNGSGPNGHPDYMQIDRLGVAILRDWLTSDPRNQRSAGDYYSVRLARGKLLLDNEVAIADYCRSRFSPKSATFLEMGTGFGELSLLLALNDFQTIGFESDAGRYEGACALIAGMAQQGVDVGRLSLVKGFFPPALDLARVHGKGEMILVSTNVTSSYVMENVDSIYRALRLFDYLVVDVARFGESRDEESKRQLVADLGDGGFVEVDNIYRASDSDVRVFGRMGSRTGRAAKQSSRQEPDGSIARTWRSLTNEAEFEATLRWAERIDQLLVPVLRHQLERYGATHTGAYDFYKSRISRGELLQHYELAVAQELLLHRRGITQVDEIGSGYGQLVFLLGWNGFLSRGFEADSARAAMARRLRTMLALADPELTDRIELIEESFPSSVAPPGSNSLVITTNIIATRTPAQQMTIIEAMQQYSFALVDIQRFFEPRGDEASQRRGLSMFLDAGFTNPELFLDLDQSGLYYLFTGRGTT